MQTNCFLGLGYDWKYSFCLLSSIVSGVLISCTFHILINLLLSLLFVKCGFCIFAYNYNYDDNNQVFSWFQHVLFVKCLFLHIQRWCWFPVTWLRYMLACGPTTPCCQVRIWNPPTCSAFFRSSIFIFSIFIPFLSSFVWSSFTFALYLFDLHSLSTCISILIYSIFILFRPACRSFICFLQTATVVSRNHSRDLL